jgi:putative hydrolase of the HAD superfamily
MDLLLTDADNTLWDTNSVYADAQLFLLHQVENYARNPFVTQDRLALVRKIDQAIAAGHSLGLRYPPMLLVSTLIRTALRELPDQTYKTFSQGEDHYLAAKQFEEILLEKVRTSIPELRRGVLEGLRKLRQQNVRVIVFTEGDEERCQSLLEEHHIAEFCWQLKSARKTLHEYRQLSEGAEERAYMVGDQIDVDVRLAKQAGLASIYFPSDFRPEWTLGLDPEADYTIDNYEQIPSILNEIGG